MGDKREYWNDETRVERLKKNEKTASEPQTEYLDMDTDEEEFGRQGMYISILILNPKYYFYIVKTL